MDYSYVLENKIFSVYKTLTKQLHSDITIHFSAGILHRVNLEAIILHFVQPVYFASYTKTV